MVAPIEEGSGFPVAVLKLLTIFLVGGSSCIEDAEYASNLNGDRICRLKHVRPERPSQTNLGRQGQGAWPRRSFIFPVQHHHALAGND